MCVVCMCVCGSWAKSLFNSTSLGVRTQDPVKEGPGDADCRSYG